MCMIKNKNDMDNRRQIFDVYRDQFYSNDKERGWQLIQINFVFRSGEDIAFIQNFLKTKMKAIMTEGIGTNAIEIITTLLGNDFYCLINGNMDYLEEKKYENYIKDKLIILNETIQKVNFVIGVSNIYADYHKIYDCIAQCEKCVLHKVYKGKDRIIYFEKVPQPIYDTQFFLNDTFRKNFANALKNEDIRKISVLLEELSVVLYNYSKRTDGKTVLGIYDILVEEFYLTIFGYSQNDEVIESKKEILQQGRYFYSVSGLFHYLGEIIGSEIQSISKKKEEDKFAKYKKLLNVKAQNSADPITSLSGGNQQKVFLARWLNTEAEILLLDNPTQGIDVGAKAEIYKLILELAESGKTILINTLEIPELQKVADRCAIFYDGELVKMLKHEEINEETVMMYSTNAVNTGEER